MLTKLMTAVLILWLVQETATTDSAHSSLEAARNAKSEEMRKYMNYSADPCEDFFDFACGNWKTHYPTDAVETWTDAIYMAIMEFSRRLIQLLTTVDDMDTETELKVKNFYASCLNLASLKQAEYNENLKEIAQEFGQMPALAGDAWLEEDFDWLKTVAEISHKYGLNIILGYYIFLDRYDHTANTIGLSKQYFEIESDFDVHRENYERRVVNYLKKHLDIEDDLAHVTAKEIADFEAVLLTAGHGEQEIEKASNKSTDFATDLYIDRLFNISYGSIPTGAMIDIYPYVESVIGIMKRTPKRVVANYIFYKLVDNFRVPVAASKIALEEYCVDLTEEYFPGVVSYMIYRTNDLTENEQDFAIMLQTIKSTLQMILESSKLSWFDDKSREFALEKLHSLKMLLPSYKENNFDVKYAHLAIDNQNFLENLKSVLAFKAATDRASLDEMPQYMELGLNMYTPMYMAISNTALTPVSVLATDFFWSKLYPKALNYARIGFLTSHELIHAFSGEGRHYNKLGNLAGGWDKDMEQEYDDRLQCLYDQYHNYTYGGQPLPQEKDQAENAADNAGIVLAYEAYRKWYEDSGRTKSELDLETLPHLSYDNKQLFFINYAQLWCADVYEPERAVMAAGDVHSPGQFRVLVPLKNFGEFAKAFKCPKGTAMNPVKKCEIY